MMFSKVLIANRGEIALRIIRACREMGIRTVAVFSEADAHSLHSDLADERVCIGSPISSKSYLNIERLIQAAMATQADAVHPGYGYLAENESFAQACEKAGLVFIGPSPQNLKLAGDKIAAKRGMKSAGVPVIPSSDEGVVDVEAAARIAEVIGYPVMVKASGGGGGRGIRVCETREDLLEEFPVARMEARAAFGSDEVYIEKRVEKPRHIEFQILADHYGNTIHLGERECTIQRRYQKLIEESPSPFLNPQQRKEMGAAAVNAAVAVGYVNAGTVEFLVDAEGGFYFMEINSRIQVEHPVTELTTGIDLVKEQIRIAAGEKLEYTSQDIQKRGWAIECRINAEDPAKNFFPSPGKIETYHAPGGFGVRLDTHLYIGYELPIYYDSLIAKLISYDLTRDGAIRIMKRALQEYRIAPIKTTIPFYLKIMDDPEFLRGTFDTGYVKKFLPDEADDDEED
jgi:acetyl-CoA carboxylase biotin carboxylase subunit